MRMAVLAALAVASSGIGAGSPQPRPQSEMIAFTGVSVVSMKAGEGVAADQTVLVGDGRIIAIGPASEVDVPPAATRVEAAGKYLMPGLADMHVHLEIFDDPHLLRPFIANGVGWELPGDPRDGAGAGPPGRGSCAAGRQPGRGAWRGAAGHRAPDGLR